MLNDMRVFKFTTLALVVSLVSACNDSGAEVENTDTSTSVNTPIVLASINNAEVQFNDIKLYKDAVGEYSHYSLERSLTPFFNASDWSFKTISLVKNQVVNVIDYWSNTTFVYANNLEQRLGAESLEQSGANFTYVLTTEANEQETFSMNFNAIDLSGVSAVDGSIDSAITNELSQLMTSVPQFPEGAYCFNGAKQIASTPLFLNTRNVLNTSNDLVEDAYTTTLATWQESLIAKYGEPLMAEQQQVGQNNSLTAVKLVFVDETGTEFTKAVVSKDGLSYFMLTDYVVAGTTELQTKPDVHNGAVACQYFNDVATNHLIQIITNHF